MLSTSTKASISVLSAVIFCVVASPFMYMLTSSVFGSSIAINGCPTLIGLVLHTVVFGLITFGTMFIPLTGIGPKREPPTPM